MLVPSIDCHHFYDTRYCGKQSGLYPRDDDWTAAKIDEIIDTATDITVISMLMMMMMMMMVVIIAMIMLVVID